MGSNEMTVVESLALELAQSKCSNKRTFSFFPPLVDTTLIFIPLAYPRVLITGTTAKLRT